ncbi:Glycosyl transferase family 2 [Actinomadura rubteroloni]|uniref:4,4'-diaponeurosporenoate glycosyltransferase n=1 Tax=Actinomadura rubteroloni TaxID=1926885 RepID=A0A2P4UKJ6_9ACTN|nr:glycosyltransferase [Actinomadura rubteroloni]POM25546.1 Glycosyl transferase family 2 [Actinomadura rubteroloni]
MIAGVVVPAHDEERRIGACLAALRLTGAPVVVVADACADRTAALARTAGATVVEIAARNVGAARAAGVAELLARGAEWIATTDADTLVPPCWLRAQLRHAAHGYDAVAGPVTVTDWTGHPPWLPALFARRYNAPGLHGANLGFTARAYRAAGGFPPLPTGEDRALVTALEATGHRVLRTGSIGVVTSARHDYRAPDGFGHLLSSLADQGEPAA